jgi:hypothetical protein
MLELRTGTLCLHIAERIQFHNIHGLNNTSSVCCESGLWLNFRPKRVEWDLVMLHADLGTDKSSLILFVPKRASYAREINAVQKIYRDDAVYCLYRSWTFPCLDIDFPSHFQASSTHTYPNMTCQHKKTHCNYEMYLPYLFPIWEF